MRLHVSDEGGRLDIGALAPAPGELVFACGPRRMVDALEDAARAWPAETLHVERFEARALTEPVLHQSFEVELAISGTPVDVAAGQRVLDAVAAAGVFVLSSCRAGTCGTCRVHVEPAEGLTPPTLREKARGCTGPYRLACQAQVASEKHDLVVTKMEGFLGKGARAQGS